MRSIGISVMCLCSISNRYTHFSIIKFCIHFLSVIRKISPINLRTFSKWFFQSKNQPRGASKFFRMLRKIRTKFCFKTVLKIPVRKVPQGRSNFFQNIFFLIEIFRYTSFFNIFLWKFEISLQKSISNRISTQLCQQII